MKKSNIFIAHHYKDEEWIEPFKQKLGGSFDIRDSSIVETEPNNASNPEYIKREYLRPSIDWAGKLIVLVSKDTKNSNPDCGVNWEVEYANKKGYPITAIYLPSATEADLTPTLRDYSDNFVRWDNDVGLIAALGGSIISQGSDGGKRPIVSGGGVACA
jgi:hypothetical protein